MSVNRRVKRWPGWLALVLVAFALFAVGASRDGGPETQQDRIDAIGRRLACPTCAGESVYVSRAAAAEAIRNEIARQVATGERSDDDIVAFIEDRFGGQVLLVPKATGLDALVWVLPVVVLVVAVAGLAVAFRRWQREPVLVPTDEDRALVAAALADEHAAEHDRDP